MSLAFGRIRSLDTSMTTVSPVLIVLMVALLIGPSAATYSYDGRRVFAPTYAATDELNATRGIDEAVRLGRAGEAAAGIVKNTSRIQLPGGGYRVPDVLDRTGGLIGEVKNVQSLSYTAQLRDYAAYAQSYGYRFELWVRPSTYLSGPLREAIAGKEIFLRYLP